MSGPHDGDTEPSPPPVDPDMIDAMAADLAALEAYARHTGRSPAEAMLRLIHAALDAGDAIKQLEAGPAPRLALPPPAPRERT